MKKFLHHSLFFLLFLHLSSSLPPHFSITNYLSPFFPSSPSVSLSHKHTHTHMVSLYHTLSHSHTYIVTQAYSLSLTHAHTNTDTRIPFSHVLILCLLIFLPSLLTSSLILWTFKQNIFYSKNFLLFLNSKTKHFT